MTCQEEAIITLQATEVNATKAATYDGSLSALIYAAVNHPENDMIFEAEDVSDLNLVMHEDYQIMNELRFQDVRAIEDSLTYDEGNSVVHVLTYGDGSSMNIMTHDDDSAMNVAMYEDAITSVVDIVTYDDSATNVATYQDDVAMSIKMAQLLVFIRR